ncbi:TPA: TonB-dependent receptor [Pasteurella multocida]|nr:TonB-dependent receptor [Pasteurella multocida]HDR1547944.1 TonB-dependent receptor [Pasteurella multocida]HDR1885065.1 TonB-dependent receptor [Pasteurella multocida]
MISRGCKVNKFFVVLMMCCIPQVVWANTEKKQIVFLDEISVESKGAAFRSDPLSGLPKQNDILVSKQKLKTGSSTLGNALAGELSVHSNQFGGGTSAPVVRGQEGVRLKILQNGSDVIDMSQLSPDHAIGVDTLLAEQVEIVRGASTLLYANASPAGVINVVDKRIPTQLPQKGYEVDFNTRYNTNSHEKLVTAALTFGLGKHIALRVEELLRGSNNYHVPAFKLDKTLNYVPDTQNKTKSGNYGVAFIGERGYVGFAYNLRREKYGLPGHNHKLDSCAAHIWGGNVRNDYYLGLYPHLMHDTDLVNTHFHCGSNHDMDGKHSHNHPYGHDHDHSIAGPLIDSYAKRYDIRAEVKQPMKAIEKIKLSYSETRYKHDEKDDNIAVNLFKNNGYNLRVEIFHTPIAGLSGVIGAQYQTQTSSANIPRIAPCSNNASDPCHKKKQRDPSKITKGDRKSWALIENTQSQMSFFAIEQLRWQDFLFEIGVRTEKQRIDIEYDRAWLFKVKRKLEGCDPNSFFYSPSGCRQGSYPAPDFASYHDRATSYSGAISWNMTPDYTLSLTYSHNERHPTPMELYYHGKHLATVSFEHGNRNLKKEVSDNWEVGLAYLGDKLSYKVNVYYNDFKNRIFNQTLNKSGNLSLNRYNQSKAKYYGVEGRIDYALTPELRMGLFGDYVRGKLYDLPPTYRVDHVANSLEPVPQPDQDAPRVPPMRLGFRVNMEMTESLTSSLEYTYVYQQKKVAPLENQTAAYSLLNIGVDYSRQIAGVNYQLFVQANNMLNRKVYSHTSFLPFVPQMGRNVTLGLNIHF